MAHLSYFLVMWAIRMEGEHKVLAGRSTITLLGPVEQDDSPLRIQVPRLLYAQNSLVYLYAAARWDFF